MNAKSKSKNPKYSPTAHLNIILIIAVGAVGISFFIFYVYWMSISRTTTDVIVNPSKEGISFIQKVFPRDVFIEIWRQQQIIWSLLTRGFQELVRSFSSF